MAQSEEEKTLLSSFLSFIFKSIKLFLKNVTQYETAFNVRALNICKDTYSGPFRGYIEETLSKQRKILRLRYFAILPLLSLGYSLSLVLDSIKRVDTNPFKCDGIDSCLANASDYLDRVINLMGDDGLIVLIGSISVYTVMFFWVYIIEHANTITQKRNYFKEILDEQKVTEKDPNAQILYFENLGVFVNSKKITEASIVNDEVIWKTINIDPGKPIKNTRVKSAFFIPTKFELPARIIYEKEDFN